MPHKPVVPILFYKEQVASVIRAREALKKARAECICTNHDKVRNQGCTCRAVAKAKHFLVEAVNFLAMMEE